MGINIGKLLKLQRTYERLSKKIEELRECQSKIGEGMRDELSSVRATKESSAAYEELTELKYMFIDMIEKKISELEERRDSLEIQDNNQDNIK